MLKFWMEEVVYGHICHAVWIHTARDNEHKGESWEGVEAAKKACQAMGAMVKDFYAVMGMGQYDTLFILEAPDDEAIAKAAFVIGSLGSVRTETHRAFAEDEYKRIIAALP